MANSEHRRDLSADALAVVRCEQKSDALLTQPGRKFLAVVSLFSRAYGADVAGGYLLGGCESSRLPSNSYRQRLDEALGLLSPMRSARTACQMGVEPVIFTREGKKVTP